MQFQALVFTPLAQPGSRSRVCDALVARQYQMREVRDVAGLLGCVQRRAADVIVLGAGPGCNWAGIDFTASEFLLDFGQFDQDTESAIRHTRIIANPTSARVFLKMLADVVAEYEAKVGPIGEAKR